MLNMKSTNYKLTIQLSIILKQNDQILFHPNRYIAKNLFSLHRQIFIDWTRTANAYINQSSPRCIIRNLFTSPASMLLFSNKRINVRQSCIHLMRDVCVYLLLEMTATKYGCVPQPNNDRTGKKSSHNKSDTGRKTRKFKSNEMEKYIGNKHHKKVCPKKKKAGISKWPFHIVSFIYNSTPAVISKQLPIASCHTIARRAPYGFNVIRTIRASSTSFLPYI